MAAILSHLPKEFLMKIKENCGFKVISDLPECLPVLQSTVYRFADLFAEFLAEIAQEEHHYSHHPAGYET